MPPHLIPRDIRSRALGLVGLSPSSSTAANPRPRIPAPGSGRCIINELPTELLAYIFELGAVGPPEDDSDTGADSDSEYASEDSFCDGYHVPFEVLVSHVCKLWRHIALNLPTLWNVIDLDVCGHEDEEEEFEHHRLYLETYLERAREVPLDISLELDTATIPMTAIPDLPTLLMSDSPPDNLPLMFYELRRIGALILPRYRQWRSLILSVTDYAIVSWAVKVMQTLPEAPLLEVLALYNHDDFMDMDHFEPERYRDTRALLFNGNIPKLRKLDLWGVHIDWEESTFLAGLEKLILAYHAEDVRPTYKQFSRILSESPNLQMLALYMSGPAGGPVEWSESIREGVPPGGPLIPIPRISLPSLTEFHLAYEGPISLMQYLDMPNLTSLELDLAEADHTDFFRCISRPTPYSRKSLLSGLTHFKLTDCQCAKDVIHASLHALENLESLNLNLHYLDFSWCHFLSGLFEDSAPEPRIPCPKLKTLSLRGLDGQSVVDLVHCRKHAGYPLTKLLVEESDELAEEQEAMLTNMVEMEYFQGSDTEEEDEDEEGFPRAVELIVDEIDAENMAEDEETDDETDGDSDGDVEEDDEDEEWSDTGSVYYVLG